MDLTRTTRTEAVDEEEEAEEDEEQLPKVFLGQVPIMLRSMYCILSDSNDRELTDLGECPYDQGGYFVINGSEKVLIAQEKMTNNAVYVFAKKQPSKYSHVAELKSCLDASRPASSMHVRLLSSYTGAPTQHQPPLLSCLLPPSHWSLVPTLGLQPSTSRLFSLLPAASLSLVLGSSPTVWKWVWCEC